MTICKLHSYMKYYSLQHFNSTSTHRVSEIVINMFRFFDNRTCKTFLADYYVN